MDRPSEDPIVQEKHRVQAKLLEEAGGDLRKYSEIVRQKVKELRERNPGSFPSVSTKRSIAA